MREKALQESSEVKNALHRLQKVKTQADGQNKFKLRRIAGLRRRKSPLCLHLAK